MTYALFSILSVFCFLGAAIWAFCLMRARYHHGRFFTPTKVMFLGTFLSSLFTFIPIYWDFFDPAVMGLSHVVKTFLIAAHHSIRLFAIDSDFDIVQNAAAVIDYSWLKVVFTSMGAILFITAPILTFSFILSFFKNFAAYRKLFTHPKSALYIFSELSEKSLALAKSIVKEDKKALVIFSDVYEKDEEESFDLIEESKELGAICLKSDMLSLNLSFHFKSSGIYFFAISEDDSENISQALSIITNPIYRYRKNTRFYIFSVTTEGELVISNLQSGLAEESKRFEKQEAKRKAALEAAKNGEKAEAEKSAEEAEQSIEETAEDEKIRNPEIRVKRVNDMRSLVYRTLYDEGDQLFKNAIPVGEGEKLVSALILGTGGQGGEMIRALAWFCQMENTDVKYRVRINAFDRDPKAKEKFAATCPELVSEEYNGVLVDGEAQYRIDVHGGIDIDTTDFTEMVRSLGEISYTFISLGSDELNIRAAVTLRMLFERMRLPQKPIIQAVVYDSKNKKALLGAKNAFGNEYDIELVGDRDTLYSADIIIDSELEEAALEIHRRYDESYAFWAHEYNYNSSMASAIHDATRIKLGIYGAGKTELTKDERDFIEVLEHRRWNAYMRSEGWVYSGSKEKASRNNLGKMHHNLVCFDDLSEEDKRKDSIVATRRKT